MAFKYVVTIVMVLEMVFFVAFVFIRNRQK